MKIRQQNFSGKLPGLLALYGLAMLLLTACAANGQQTTEDTAAAAKPEMPAVEQVPTSEEVMYRVFAAEYLGSEGDLAGAVEEYLAAAMESNDPEIAKRATRIAYAAEAWQQASMAADRWALLDPENVAAHESAAAAKLSVGDYLGAEYQIMQILDLMEDSTEAWLLLSSLLMSAGDPAQADAILQQILLSRPNADPADVFFARSKLAIRSRKMEQAFELARHAVELNPERIEFVVWAGRLALNLEKTDEGMLLIHRALMLDPTDHDLALAYADLLARNGQEAAARKVMEEMPQTPDLMLSRIMFELAAEHPDDAARLFEQFARMDFADTQEKIFYQAQAAEALGQPRQAIEFYGEVRSGDHALAAALRRAELIAEEGDLEQARSALAALRQDGSELAVEESWLAEARILRQAGQREEAFQVLDVAVGQVPESIAVTYTHALLAAELGWVSIAERGLREIIAVQPENAAALNALGYTLADQTERYEEAEALIRQAYILQPNEASIIDSMGWIYYRRGKLEESVKFLRKAWAADKNPEIAAHLGEVLWVKGDHDGARQIWREGLDVDSQNAVMVETLERLEIEL